jgi:hypothetical protein
MSLYSILRLIKTKSRFLEEVLAFVAFCAFAGFWSFKLWLWGNAPRRPNPLVGVDVPIQGNGATFYVTHGQDWLLTVLVWLSIGAFICAALVDHYLDPFQWRRK